MADGTQLAQQLVAHLEERYDIRVARVSLFQPWNPHVHHIERHDGPSWVARVFPATRSLERVEGDAEILRFLQQHEYPAERCARPDPISILGEQGILVTDYVAGVLWDDLFHSASADEVERMLNTLGELLGRLHALPGGSGALAREAGSWGGDPRHEGLPSEDIAAAMALLAEVEGRVPAAQRQRYEFLREQRARADACDNLPRALIHPDFAGPNIIISPAGDPIVIDWTAAGWGPRLASFAWFLGGAALPTGGWAPQRVDAIVAGYRAHVRLEVDELARLAAAMRIRPLYFACWYFRRAIISGQPLTGPGAEFSTDAENDVMDAIAAQRGRRLSRLMVLGVGAREPDRLFNNSNHEIRHLVEIS